MENIELEQQNSCCIEGEKKMELEQVQPDNQDQEHRENHAAKKEILNSHLEELLKSIEQTHAPEAKLEKIIHFMESSLAQNSTPHFKSFWQARELCLPLFKENIPPAIRSIYWNKFSELSKEARRLKELLDEQSAFAVEQIEIAIKGLESDVARLEEPIEANAIQEIQCNTLNAHEELYITLQAELDLLNSYASHVNALRKELIKTEMRIRKKNQFFQRLSTIGDSIFPRRKEKIQEISQSFIDDIELFIKEQFTQAAPKAPFYFLRDEIKALQGAAKRLTLNTHAFNQTRLRLSECWDKIKILDKERKKEQSEQKAIHIQNKTAIQQKIDAVAEGFKAEQLSLADARRQLDEIQSSMRQVNLGRDEVRALREAIQEAQKPLLDKEAQLEAERERLEQEKVRIKLQQIEQVRQDIETLIQQAKEKNAEQLIAERESLLEKIQSLPISKLEKQQLERSLKTVRDLIAEKKEQALMNLSADDRQALQQLREVLTQRRERRQEIKDQLEALRKAAGTSGLDFEKAMTHQAQMNEEKERLEKLNHGILEIEAKLAELEQKTAK